MSQNKFFQEKIADLIKQQLASLGLNLWGLEFLAGKRPILRVYIDGPSMNGGAGINECAEASRLVGLALDLEESMPSAYVLEVSTPGLERPFFAPEQLAQQVGSQVEVQLSCPLDAFPGRKKFSGLLSGAFGPDSPEGDGAWRFRLCAQDGKILPDAPVELEFLWPQVKKARLVYVWPPKTGGPSRSESKKDEPAATKKPGRESAPAQARSSRRKES